MPFKAFSISFFGRALELGLIIFVGVFKLARQYSHKNNVNLNHNSTSKRCVFIMVDLGNKVFQFKP